jgi:hypothetical protein
MRALSVVITSVLEMLRITKNPLSMKIFAANKELVSVFRVAVLL